MGYLVQFLYAVEVSFKTEVINDLHSREKIIYQRICELLAWQVFQQFVQLVFGEPTIADKALERIRGCGLGFL